MVWSSINTGGVILTPQFLLCTMGPTAKMVTEKDSESLMINRIVICWPLKILFHPNYFFIVSGRLTLTFDIQAICCKIHDVKQVCFSASSSLTNVCPYVTN